MIIHTDAQAGLVSMNSSILIHNSSQRGVKLTHSLYKSNVKV